MIHSMDVEEFVTEVLLQVTRGAKTASNDEYQFDLDSRTSKGIHFNIAVISVLNDEQSNTIKAGAGIKVVDAGYLKENSKSTSSERISRVEFNIKHRDLVEESRLFSENNKILVTNDPEF